MPMVYRVAEEDLQVIEHLKEGRRNLGRMWAGLRRLTGPSALLH